MTRRGTLAYYLAAWVIGCFVAALLLWSTNDPPVALVSGGTLLGAYFVALVFGAGDALLFAFLTRRMMRLWDTHAVWSWLLAGSGIATGLMLLLAATHEQLTASNAFEPRSPLRLLSDMVLAGPAIVRDYGWWQAPVGGAATAVVLCLVDRAFSRPAEPSEAKQSSV